MRLIFAIKSLSQLGGGAERVFVDVVNGLERRGHEITVLSFESTSVPSFYGLGENILRIDLGATISGKTGQLLALPQARRTIIEADPDAVVAFMPSCYVPLGATLAFSNIPFVASEHNVPARYRSQPFSWLAILASRLYTQHFTAVTAQMRDLYPRAIRRKMTVLPNPVATPQPARADVIGRPDKKRRILSVGRLHEQKDHAVLIRAFAALRKDFGDWSVRILGDGPERTKLENLIDHLGVGGQVVLAGTVREIGAEYRQAQVYAIPSRYESLGLATAEALSHGLPAVGFADCPGTNQLILDGVNGILVKPGNDRIEAFSGALRELMGNDRLRTELGRRAAERSSEHDLDHVLDRWEQFLQGVSRS